MSPLDVRVAAFVLATLAVAHGTYISLQYSTYLNSAQGAAIVGARACLCLGRVVRSRFVHLLSRSVEDGYTL
jgi:hypothetical protein